MTVGDRIAPPAAMSPIVTCTGVTVSFGAGRSRVVALDAVDIAIAARERIVLLGRSGSGKTTLLHAIGGLVTPQHGQIRLGGEALESLDAVARGRARAGAVAYVFQGSNLLPHLSAAENVRFAALAAGAAEEEALEPARALALVGLSHKRNAVPAELSGGEQQRVAIARAIATTPDLLLCDEPTGQLDSDTGLRVLDLIAAVQAEVGFALMIATHDQDIANRMPRVVELSAGRIVRDVRR